MASECPVCDGTGFLLEDVCPLCEGEASDSESSCHWCDICQKDLQSAKSFQEHLQGRKHLARASGSLKRRPTVAQPTEQEFFQRLVSGDYRRIVVLTGAGVSTSAGIPDFRSSGGLYESIREHFGSLVPAVMDCPEELLSRRFAQQNPQLWEQKVLPWLRSWKMDAAPTLSHHFGAWLWQKGWLQRIYTQNVDGLHLHPSLELPRDVVVECHGSMAAGLVLYGDPLPQHFEDCCSEDFDKVDLVLVMGTSLQVAPFCGLPNMAPKGATRVLVNQHLEDCRFNSWSPKNLGLAGMRMATTTRIGKRKAVQLRPLWWDRKGSSRWTQVFVQSTCDSFVESFYRFKAEAN
ncbi:NAD-dependent deacetylase sir2A (Silent information regulator sir2A) [Durusdinium trenchii]|uniref:NAD-dependent deacetylase sir2A (Silent information regulator sir2A) n=1 Tax=Durusdinium trenchii TaxID=1381693 RepID=A0ABP0M223_9DINO